MAVIQMAEGYEWVLLSLVANILVTNVWMMFEVGKARRKYNVRYPTMYALESENKDAKAFNCAQRGHQNTLEFLPAFLVLLLLGGVQYPLVAASLGAVYTLARIQYFRGYSTGSASARYQGGARAQWLALIGLLFCTVSLIHHIRIGGSYVYLV